ncbi:MAG: heparinase II/III family protein [Pseudomonadota bacterium]
MTGPSIQDRARLALYLAGDAMRGGLASLYATPLYRWRFRGPVPSKLIIAPQDLHTADPTFAAEVLAGRFIFNGQMVQTENQPPFVVTPPSKDWADVLHGFRWLRHLRAANTAVARAQATALVNDWMVTSGQPAGPGWDPTVTANRLIAWLCHSPAILDQADHAFYRRFLKSIVLQTRFLRHTVADTADGVPRLTAAMALTYAGLCIAQQGRLLTLSSRWLDDELKRQILPDGGVISRNPGTVLRLVLDLLPLRQTFSARAVAPPESLASAIDRMMPMLRFFRHADGEAANFNGTAPFYADEMATVFAYDDTRGKPVLNASHSGYQRVEQGDAVLIMDTGKPPPLGVSGEGHGGCLSFEFSARGQRIIVNCGTPRMDLPKWTAAGRLTAAHSTVALNGRDSIQLVDSEWVEERIGPVILSGPKTVPVRRQDGNDGTTLEASHDSYLRPFAAIHQRRVTLSPDGERLEGEDRIIAKGRGSGGNADRYAVRFHLLPDVRAAQIDDFRAVLVLPNGDGWLFMAPERSLLVDESVYIADSRGPRPTQQLVVEGRWRQDATVSWVFERVADPEAIITLLETAAFSQGGGSPGDDPTP